MIFVTHECSQYSQRSTHRGDSKVTWCMFYLKPNHFPVGKCSSHIFTSINLTTTTVISTSPIHTQKQIEIHRNQMQPCLAIFIKAPIAAKGVGATLQHQKRIQERSTYSGTELSWETASSVFACNPTPLLKLSFSSPNETWPWAPTAGKINRHGIQRASNTDPR